MSSDFRKLGLLPALGLASQLAWSQNPNVVFILADDLGYGDVSCLNPESKIRTPFLDSLGRNGILFTDAHASSSLSTPSRYSVLTGRYSWRTDLKQGVYDGYSTPMITEGRRTLATLFSEAGYDTACIGKWHLGWNWTLKSNAKGPKDVDFAAPIANGVTDRGGFDYFYGIAASLDMPPYVYVENNMATAIPNRKAEKMTGLRLFRQGPIAPDFDPSDCLERFFAKSTEYVTAHKDSDRPFFLYLPLSAPHTPILPAAEYQGKTPIGPYGDFVLMVDDLVRRLADTLKENGQWDNTILIFASDNGCAPYINIPVLEAQGHYPSYIYRGAKTDIYEGGHRIPLIVSYGDRLKPRVDDSLVSLIDFYATFAEMTGHRMAANEGEDSYSMWGLIGGKGQCKRKDLVSLSGKGYLALRDKDSKLIFWYGSGGQSYPRHPDDYNASMPQMQLYELDVDASERTNLIDDPKNAKLVKELTRRMRKYVNDGRSTPGRKQSNDTQNDWEQTKLF